MRLIRVFIIFTLLLTVGCTTQPKHEAGLAEKANEHQLAASFGHQFDSAYKREGVDFSAFKSLYVAPLDLSEVEIFEHRRRASSPKLKPWMLTERDKAYYQAQYENAAIKYLSDSELFMLTDNRVESDLTLKAAITQIHPLSTKVEQQIQRVKSYSRGFGSMVIAFEIYHGDELIAVVSDRRDLGNQWEENSRVRDYMHVKNGLNTWLKRLADAITE